MISLRTPLVLLIGLAIATAIIAYSSDNLGKKLGKKRVSLFGLRPRTTATLLTISSSWVIMFVTLAALLIVSQPLRKALFNYDTVLRDTRDLKSQLLTVQGQIQRKNFELKQSSRNLEGAQVKLTAALGNERSARLAEIKARRDQGLAQQKTRDALRRQARATADLAGVESNFRAAKARLQTAQLKLQQTGAHLDQLQAKLTEARRQIRNAYLETKDAYRVNAELRGSESRLQTQVAELRAQEKELHHAVRLAQAQVDEAEELVAQVNQANVLYGNKPPRLVIGQVLSDRVVPVRTSITEVRKVLLELLAEGQSAMPAYRVKSETNPSEYVDQQPKVNMMTLFLHPGQDREPLTPDQVLDLICQMVTESPDAVSVRLVAGRNYFEGETRIEARYVVIHSKQSYRNGEVIVADRLNGMGDDAVLFKSLLDLIEKGRAASVDRHVNPPLSPREPDYYAPDTKQRLFEALRRLESLKRPAEVRIIAEGDQTTVDPLRVRFEIE